MPKRKNGTGVMCAYCGSVHLIHGRYTMPTLDAFRGFIERAGLSEEENEAILDDARGTRPPSVVETTCCADCSEAWPDYKINQ